MAQSAALFGAYDAKTRSDILAAINEVKDNAISIA